MRSLSLTCLKVEYYYKIEPVSVYDSVSLLDHGSLRTENSYLLHRQHQGGIFHTVYSRAHIHKHNIA